MAQGLLVNRESRLVHPEVVMRSDLIFGAITNVPNRFLLSQLASKAARKLHRSGNRMQDTANDVLERFGRANPIGCEQAFRERLVVPLHPIGTHPVIPHKSKVVTLPPVRVKSNPLWEAARVLGA
jgi:hypothetical protein